MLSITNTYQKWVAGATLVLGATLWAITLAQACNILPPLLISGKNALAISICIGIFMSFFLMALAYTMFPEKHY